MNKTENCTLTPESPECTQSESNTNGRSDKDPSLLAALFRDDSMATELKDQIGAQPYGLGVSLKCGTATFDFHGPSIAGRRVHLLSSVSNSLFVLLMVNSPSNFIFRRYFLREKAKIPIYFGISADLDFVLPCYRICFRLGRQIF